MLSGLSHKGANTEFQQLLGFRKRPPIAREEERLRWATISILTPRVNSTGHMS